jgi:hypothetical protein
MTSQEFIQWLRGFTEGVHEYNVTPKQWDLLKERLEEVNDDEFEETPGTFQHHTLQSYPPYYDPYSPFKVTSNSLTGSGTTNISGFAITTTPNTQGYITAYNPVTFTTTGYPSGSNITYTTGGPNGTTVTYTADGRPTWYSINKIENDSREK